MTQHTPGPIQPIKPGDVFGQCPKCREQWELTGDNWTCDHCGYTLSVSACVNACAGLNPDAVPDMAVALRIAKRLLDPLIKRTRSTWTHKNQSDYLAFWLVAEPERAQNALDPKEIEQARTTLAAVRGE